MARKKFRGTTHVVFVLDKSGSMAAVEDDAREGFNGYKNDRLQDEKTTFTLVLFDTTYTVVCTAAAVADVADLTKETYRPAGFTALYDAVARAIQEIEPQVSDKDRVLFVVLTDGQENSSAEYNSASLSALVKERESRGNWTFTYLGANQDAWAEAQLFGAQRGNVADFDIKDIGQSIRYASRGTSAFMGSAQPQSSSFFSGVKKYDVDEI